MDELDFQQVASISQFDNLGNYIFRARMEFSEMAKCLGKKPGRQLTRVVSRRGFAVVAEPSFATCFSSSTNVNSYGTWELEPTFFLRWKKRLLLVLPVGVIIDC
jgi:hypothetical protein